MAYAALLSLSQAIEHILPNDQDYISFSTKHQMISLHRNIISLQEFLESTPMKFTSMVSPLETRLIDVAYKLEDLIELKSTQRKPTKVKEKIMSAFFNLLGQFHASSPISPPLDVTAVFNRCIQEVSAILLEAEEIFKQNIDTSAHDPSTPSSSIVEPSNNDAKVGLDESLKQILERVTGGMNALQVIPIVGMGGIGKTTLAKAVYDRVSEGRHFDVYVWVTISQNYNIRDILLRLLHEKQSTARIEQDLGSLITSVYQSLYKQRFLIVLDDMWDAGAWNGVMTAIPNNSNGSRVILTTRLSDVAETVSSSSPQHQMTLLNGDQSWDLLREKVYGQKTCTPEFETVGRSIAKNCSGLPLRIVVVAGMLKSNVSKGYWEEVERNINEAIGQLDAVLSLSYDNLPPHLKSCFLYFGAFPEDESIQAGTLILYWVSEGFVKPNATKTPEEIAEEYLMDLVKRSLVQVLEKSDDGKIETCGIHDVLRELSLIKAKEDKFLQCFTDSDVKHGVNLQNIITSQRRVSVLFTNSDSLSFPHINDDTSCNTTTRSLLFMDDSVPVNEQLVWLLTSRLKLLKVLVNVVVTSDSMLSHLFELTNLRLLQFSITSRRDDDSCHPSDSSDSSTTTLVVPKSISNLQKLQTLIVRGDDDVKLILPVDIWKIHELRHIHLLMENCTLALPPTELSEAYPVLQHLQTVSFATNLELTESLVLRTPNLKQLDIHYRFEPDLHASYYVKQYRLKNLVHLRKLEYLGLEVQSEVLLAPCMLTGFVLTNNLRSLTLSGGYIISWEQMSSVVGSLRNLQQLYLTEKAVEGSTWEPEEGQFLRLKSLEMSYLELQSWVAESTHFPCLEELVLECLEYLEEIPLDIGYIETLRKLKVDRCSEEAKNSAEEIQEEQQSLANNLLQVEIVKEGGGGGGVEKEEVDDEEEEEVVDDEGGDEDDEGDEEEEEEEEEDDDDDDDDDDDYDYYTNKGIHMRRYSV